MTRHIQPGRVHPTPAQPYDGSHDREIDSLAEFDEVVPGRGTLAHFRVQRST